MTNTSLVTGFYKLSVDERIRHVQEFSQLSPEEVSMLKQPSALPMDTVDRMVENVIGKFEMPLGVAANFFINGRDYFVPMAIEEPSVIAAASNAAKLSRSGGGIHAGNTGPVMIAQIQTVGLPDPFRAKMAILEHKEEIIAFAKSRIRCWWSSAVAP